MQDDRFFTAYFFHIGEKLPVDLGDQIGLIPQPPDEQRIVGFLVGILPGNLHMAEMPQAHGFRIGVLGQVLPECLGAFITVASLVIGIVKVKTGKTHVCKAVFDHFFNVINKGTAVETGAVPVILAHPGFNIAGHIPDGPIL